MKFFIQISLFFLILFIGIYVYFAVYIIKNAQKDEKRHADVILVLGAKAYRSNKYNPCLVARVKHAADLYKANYAHKLLFSGGNDKTDNVNEAQTMKKIAQSFGIPSKDILLETESTSTYENLLFSEKLLKAKKLESIILVTEPFHSPRANLIAQKLGLNAFSSPAINSICWLKHPYLSRYFLREPLAIMVYRIQNKL